MHFSGFVAGPPGPHPWTFFLLRYDLQIRFICVASFSLVLFSLKVLKTYYTIW